MNVTRSLATLVVASALAACGSIQLQSPIKKVDAAAPASDQQAAMAPCTHPVQTGCIDLRILPLAYNAQNSLMVRATQPVETPAERAYRIEKLPVDLRAQAIAGTAQISPNHSYLVYMWGVKEVPVTTLRSWRITNMQTGAFVRGTVEEVKNPPPSGLSSDSQLKGLGAPKVYRVRATNGQVSLQVPYAFFGATSAFMVCAEDGSSIYPKHPNGLQTPPGRVAYFKANQAQNQMARMVFLH